MPWIIMAQREVNGVQVHTPRFVVNTSEADALALSTRLNRAATITYWTDQYPSARRGPDHELWNTNGIASLQAMDAQAVPGTHYSVGQASEYTGPNEDVTPVLQALMVAYASHSSDPPASVHEAIFRLIRDGAPPPEPPPEP